MMQCDGSQSITSARDCTRRVPCLLIAATQSGSGKTSLAIGIVAALRKRHLRVQTFKVGPDYLDPTWLTAVSQRPCYNLDGWMSGHTYVTSLLEKSCQDADVAIIEGVMGLYDSSHPASNSGSTAEIAQWLDAPILLVVPARGVGRSFAAIVAGFVNLDSKVNIIGVIANGCGSEKHRRILAESLACFNLPPLLGSIPHGALPALPSRHLGLVGAGEAADRLGEVFEQFAQQVEKYIDVERLLSLLAVEKSNSKTSAIETREASCEDTSDELCIAVALDAAFHFYYPDLFDELTKRGFRVEFFSPLHDRELPTGTDAVFIGGGYPEEHAARLAANLDMKEAILRFAHSGRPIYAECGGLMYLSQSIVDRYERRFPMVGLLPAETRLCSQRQRLGYVEITLKEDTLWGKAGDCLRGHEFHYAELVNNPAESPEWTAIYFRRFSEGVAFEPEGFWCPSKSILASFVHLHLASAPKAISHFCNFVRSRKNCTYTSAGTPTAAKESIGGPLWKTRWIKAMQGESSVFSERNR